MAKPDVRVRLSAEGVAEVVGALKKISKESEKTGKGSGRHFKGLNNVLNRTKNLVGGMLAALSVRQLTRWIKSSIDATDAIAKMGTKVGASTENLSALNLVARTADADLAKVGSALAKMNKNIGEAARGNPKAIATFRDLGFSLKDLENKDAVEVFEMLSKRIVALPTQTERGTTAMNIFGKSGSDLLRTMRDLAEEGLGAVIERARELGVLIDTDLAAAAEGIKDDFELLKAQGEGIGMRFAAGLVPEVSQALQTVSGDLKQTTTVWESAGMGIGRTIKWITAIVSTGFDYMGTHIGLFAVRADASIRAFLETLRFNFDEAKEITRKASEYIVNEEIKLAERIAGRFVLAARDVVPPSRAGLPGEEDGEGEEDPAELAAKKAQAMQMALDRELALVRTAASLKHAEERRQFKEALQGVEQYYSDRRDIIEASYKAEVATLEKKRDLLAAEVDPARRLQEEKKIEGELAKARMLHEGAVLAILSEQRETVKGLGKERLAVEKAILAAQGKSAEIARLAIEQQIQKARELLIQQEVGEEERIQVLARLRNALEAVADFADAKRNAEQTFAQFQAARADIEAQIAAGYLSQMEGEQQLLELEKDRLVALKQIADALIAAAEVTGDPEKIAQAQNYAAAIRQISYSVEASSNALANLKDTAIDAAHTALSEFFADGLEGSKSLAESIEDMASSFIAAIRRMAAELMASQVMTFLGSLIPGGGGDFIGPMPAARGGLIRGPGTGTSDSIPARLSDEEFVTRSWAVRQPGVLRHLDEINRLGARALIRTPVVRGMPVRGFAEGGLVSPQGAGQEESGRMDGKLLVGLEEGLILRAMETPAGERFVVKTIRNHSREIRSALR